VLPELDELRLLRGVRRVGVRVRVCGVMLREQLGLG
jgi:hypothetical protein